MTPELAELLHEVTGHSTDRADDADRADHSDDAGHTNPAGHRFGHRQHINLAWLAVRRYGMPDAADKVCEWLRQMTAYEQAPQKYNHTMSRAWVYLVAHHTTVPADEDTPIHPFDQFITDHPALLDKRLLSRHYSSHVLASATARTAWAEPDLLPLP